MSSKHTPGPWSAYVDRSTKTIAVDIGPDPHGGRPCIVDWTGFDGCDLPLNQRIANARLIAAAPDLLEALKDMLNAENTYPYGGMSESEIAAIQKARAAIAKAEGA